MSKRCLVPSTGYFEWHHEGKKKIPYFIYMKDEEIFSMAGVYDKWHDKQADKIIYTFSIITGLANELTGHIHNGGNNPQRMPIILSREAEAQWLNPELGQNQIQELLQTFPSDKMDAYQIKNDFIKKRSNDKTILDKAA